LFITTGLALAQYNNAAREEALFRKADVIS
jgi:hypothetical protein